MYTIPGTPLAFSFMIGYKKIIFYFCLDIKRRSIIHIYLNNQIVVRL